MPTISTPFSRAKLLIAGLVLVLLLVAWLVPFAKSDRTVTAHFPQAISVFEGSDVTIMGVPVGEVTEVVPEGDSVKVVMTYSADHKLPADVKAAIVTPTLVADRFVQLVPAYSGGPALADGGDIPLERSVVPVEMDRIYRSIVDLTEALGPSGANKDGALGKALASTADALSGKGELGHDAIENLAEAAGTLGDGAPELFATVEALAEVTDQLAAEDEAVNDFMQDLATVSTQLSGESDELRQALAAIARAITVTETFVKDNRKLLTQDLADLGRTLRAVTSDRAALKKTLDLAPLGLGNLALSFDAVSGGAGIRVQLGPEVTDLAGVLCTVIINAGVPMPDLVCQLFKALLPPSVTAPIGGAITDGGVPVIDLPDAPLPGATAAKAITDGAPAPAVPVPSAATVAPTATQAPPSNVIDDVKKILQGLS